jgi:hypothetical protein
MEGCEYIKTCAFYRNEIEDMPENALFARRLYCHRRPERCRRRRMAEEHPVEDTDNRIFPLNAEVLSSG